jgi:allantoin racemase
MMRRALAEDGSDAIVLGCAGMAELCAEIEDALGAPVIEGVTAAVKWTEALVSLRLSTAKRGDYARPLAKRYDGALASFSPVDADPNPRAPRGSTEASSANAPENAGTSDLVRVNTTEPGRHIHSV